jgi:hypothetical protein
MAARRAPASERQNAGRVTGFVTRSRIRATHLTKLDGGGRTMGIWEASPLKMSGAEFEVQEALLGLRRLMETGAIRPTTRVILEGAVKALEGELESPSPG